MTARKTATAPSERALRKRALGDHRVGASILASVECDPSWINLVRCALLAAQVQSPYKEDHQVLEALLDAMVERQRAHLVPSKNRSSASTIEDAQHVVDQQLDKGLVTWARSYLKKRDIAQHREPRNLKSPQLTCIRELIGEIERTIKYVREHRIQPRKAKEMVASIAVAHLSQPATPIRPDGEEREAAKTRVYQALLADQAEWSPPRERPAPISKREWSSTSLASRSPARVLRSPPAPISKGETLSAEKLAKLILRAWTLKQTKVIDGWFKAT